MEESIVVGAYSLDIFVYKTCDIPVRVEIRNAKHLKLSKFIALIADPETPYNCILVWLHAPKEHCDSVRPAFPKTGRFDILMQIVKALARDVLHAKTITLEDCAVVEINSELDGMLLSVTRLLNGLAPAYYKYGFRSLLFRDDVDLARWQTHLDTMRLYTGTARIVLQQLLCDHKYTTVLELWDTVIPTNAKTGLWTCVL